MSIVRISAAAELDFTEALCWYADRNAEVALAFDLEFENALKEIKAFPDRFPRCSPSFRLLLMRRFPFQIIYQVIQDDLTIIAVAHTSRKPGSWASE